MLSFFENLRNYYHNNHGIEDSVHDNDHNHVLDLVLVHVYKFVTILHLLKGMVQIQLDETGDLSSKAYYFVQ